MIIFPVMSSSLIIHKNPGPSRWPILEQSSWHDDCAAVLCSCRLLFVRVFVMPIVPTSGNAVTTPLQRLTQWRQAWPVAGLALAAVVNVMWVGLLGYMLTKVL
jgi:hypothetical protein